MEKPSPLGFGLGLRPVYYEDILERNPNVDWFEVLSENYMVPGGRPLAMLERFRADYPIVMHGVSMSIASTAPLDVEYLKALKELADRFQPEWISDHLCWTGVHGVNLHDLLPIPYTADALDHIVERIRETKEAAKLFGDQGGSVINIGSVASDLNSPNTVVYTATKGAVDAVTRVLAKELGPRNIRVNAIKPGVIETEGTHATGVIGSDFEKQLVAQTPLGRTGQPDDIAPVAVFLASDESRWVTGDTLAVSGGIG
jgi:NAD(P)-dependent dehydrogenase (short-subunit alcohol dehydrogenase family)